MQLGFVLDQDLEWWSIWSIWSFCSYLAARFSWFAVSRTNDCQYDILKLVSKTPRRCQHWNRPNSLHRRRCKKSWTIKDNSTQQQKSLMKEYYWLKEQTQPSWLLVLCYRIISSQGETERQRSVTEMLGYFVAPEFFVTLESLLLVKEGFPQKFHKFQRE